MAREITPDRQTAASLGLQHPTPKQSGASHHRPYVRYWLIADIQPPSDLRPLYPRKQTLVALQSFGLKKRTSEVGFTTESGHKRRVRLMSANDPKRTSHELKSNSVENRVRCTENQ